MSCRYDTNPYTVNKKNLLRQELLATTVAELRLCALISD